MNSYAYGLATLLALGSAAACAQHDAERKPLAPTQGSAAAQPLQSPRDSTPHRAADFTKHDADGNGVLNAVEFGNAQMTGITIAQFDRNGDGAVSRDEWNKYQAAKREDRR